MSLKILIAEDQPTAALMLRRLLERLGHEVTAVPDGDAAWRSINRERFQVVILDWGMPGLDGPSLCRLVRAEVGWPYTYLILLTMRQSHEDRLAGLRAGADDFLVKPPHFDELAVRLEIARRILGIQDELERQNRLLADLANRDELTGVPNRRAFRATLAGDFDQHRRSGQPLSLVMLDVDHFKQYNDAFGHPAGDDVLRGVGGILSDGVGRPEGVSRFGGEEFAVLLPASGEDAALGVAEALRGAIESAPWPHRAITASLGVATTGLEVDRPDQLVDAADAALYQSKRAGRNRVTHARALPAEAGPATRAGPGGFCG